MTCVFLPRQHLPVRLVLTLTASLLFFTSTAISQDATPAPKFQLDGAKPVQYKEVDGVKLNLHVFYPRDWNADDRRAAIVFFFGGGWVGGTPKQFEPQCQHLASRGIVAISAEYRVKSRHGTQPWDCVADGKSAVRWIRTHADQLGIDPQRIAAAGGSAGGHVAASTALLDDPDATDSTVSSVPNALVLFNPVIDTTEMGFGAKALGDRMRELSPAHHVRPGMPPTIVYHGGADRTVPFENAQRFQRLMTENGNACRLVTYEGAGHGFFNTGRHADSFEDTLKKTDEFLTAIGFLPVPESESALTAAATVEGRSLHQWTNDLASDNRTTRLRAAKTLGLFGSSAVPPLRKLLTDPDSAVRYWAAYHLADVGMQNDELRSQLTELLDDDSQGVRMAAAYALVRIGVPSQLDVLVEALDSDERGAACTAAELLGRLGPSAENALDALRATMARHEQGGDYHVLGASRHAVRGIMQDRTITQHERPSGGPAPRSWNPGSGEAAAVGSQDPRPNILWISCEDISPNLGCYGDAYASTPNLDQLAREGARFDRAFTPAGVCAVVRSGIITGMYPISIGSHHMRSNIVPPPNVRCFTEYLRAAGYFCTNKSKTDYQFDAPVTAWDRQGERHNDWRDRAPGQPFFSVINLTISHESQIRHGENTHQLLLERLKPEQRHNPDQAAEFLPPIYPNTPEARKDWAWYQDNISEMDRQAGEILGQLEADGLRDNTVVVFWGDHGRGLPRGKRWIYDSGVHVPLIVRWPGKVGAGSVREDLVSTQDFAPTMLALAGTDPKPHMHGRIFLGEQAQPEPDFLFLHRDRMDETYELMRGVRDRRFKYIRNYASDKTYAQHIDYMDKMPTLVDLRNLHAEGRLTHVQGRFFRERKPVEELYDLQRDPHETTNLAWLPEYADRVAKMRSVLVGWQQRVGDLGLVPEPILLDELRPGNRYQTTDAPVIAVADRSGQTAEVRINCSTEGASIAYRLQPKGETANRQQWSLYVGPITVDEGTTVVAKACRLGFRDSGATSVRLP